MTIANHGGQRGLQPPLELVRKIVCEESVIAGIDPGVVFTSDRRRAVSWVRHRVCKRLHSLGKYSLPGIGKQLNIDHTTVIFAIRRVWPEKSPTLTVSTLSKRFWEKVSKGGDNDCWPWTGGTSSFGYGRIYSGGGRALLAHRVSYKFSYGPIPRGLFVLHHCDNPRCCNPNHLFLGTQAQNMADCSSKDRIGTWKSGGHDLRGEKNGNAKLTPDDVHKVRLAQGKQRDIASEFGISQAQVWNIKNGRQWAHIPRSEIAPPSLARLMGGRA